MTISCMITHSIVIMQVYNVMCVCTHILTYMTLYTHAQSYISTGVFLINYV